MVNQTARIENGLVHLPREVPWLDDYVYELAVFPNGKHDDQVDSTSQALAVLEKPVPWQGLRDYYQQLAQGNCRKPPDDEIWMIAGSGSGIFWAIDGTEYQRDEDGIFRIPARHAPPLLSVEGCRRVWAPA